MPLLLNCSKNSARFEGCLVMRLSSLKALLLLQLLLIFVFSTCPGQAQTIIDGIPAGSVYQHIASTTFSSGDVLILSAYAAATGSVRLGFAKTIRVDPNSKWEETKTVHINYDNKTGEASIYGDINEYEILDHGVIKIASMSNLLWNRLFITFKYSAKSDDFRSYIFCNNSTPDTELLDSNHSAWFDGIQLERLVLPGQTRPTSYHPVAKFLSPNAAVSLDGRTAYFEW